MNGISHPSGPPGGSSGIAKPECKFWPGAPALHRDKVSIGLDSWKTSGWLADGCILTVPSHACICVYILIFSPHKDISHIGIRLTLMTSFKLKLN